MRKYYKIFRIDAPFVEIHNNETDMYDICFTSENCLVKDGDGVYESEEEAEKMLNDYFENFPYRAKYEEYVIVKCYKMEK